MCSHIKYRSVHKTIEDELLVHMEEQKNEYIKSGVNEENAEIKAIEQMGDPDIIGKQLNKAHRPRTEWPLLIIAFVLVILGGVVQFFISSESTTNAYMFSRYLFYAPIGVLAFTCMYFFDYTILGRYPKTVIFVMLALVIAGFFVFQKQFGAFKHVYYFALLAIPVFSVMVYSVRGKGYMGIIASGLFYAASAFICMIGPRIYACGLFTLASLILITVAISMGYFNCNKRVGVAIVYIPTVLIGGLFIVYLISFLSVKWSRIISIIRPSLDPRGSGWQHLIVKRLIKGSKPFGEAVLDGNLSNATITSVLPGWQNDFSLTFIIARLGYVAGFLIIAALLILTIRMFITISRQKNALGFLLSLGAFIAITGQVVLYILSNLGIIRFLVTLPFISYGGSAFVVNMILLGIIMSVYRRTDIVVDKLQKGIDQGHRLITIEEGRIVIDFGIHKAKRS